MGTPTPSSPTQEPTTPLRGLSPDSSLQELKNYAGENQVEVSLATGGSASRTKEQIYKEIADEQIRKACLRDNAFAKLKLDALSKDALLEYVAKHPQLNVSPQVGGPKARTLEHIYFDCVEAILRLPLFESFNSLGPDTSKKDLQAFCTQYGLDTSIVRNAVSLDELYADVTRAVVHKWMGKTFQADEWKEEVESLRKWTKDRALDMDEDFIKSTRLPKTIYLKVGAALKGKILVPRKLEFESEPEKKLNSTKVEPTSPVVAPKTTTPVQAKSALSVKTKPAPSVLQLQSKETNVSPLLVVSLVVGVLAVLYLMFY